MSAKFEEADPHVSRWDQEGAEFVRSCSEWCARCCRRLLGMNPGLNADSAFDLVQDFCQDERLRVRSPELVAEELGVAVQLPFESQWGAL